MTKALVLSGGGAVGIAWEIGVAAGLARGGVDLREADFITGTSAGSAVGARLALRRDLDVQVALYREAARRPAPAARSGNALQMPSDERMAELMKVIVNAMSQDAAPEARRAAIGRFALEARTPPEEAFLAAFADLKGEAFPAHYACPAVDALSGALAVWDADSGAELDRAVASSCAVPGLFAPITIKGRRYIDGGFRSGTNADLATGHGRVLIVSLLGAARTTGAIDSRMLPAAQLDEEVQILRGGGAEVMVLEADDAGARAMGANLMNPSMAPIALEEGIRQGEAEARRLAEFWNISR